MSNDFRFSDLPNFKIDPDKIEKLKQLSPMREIPTYSEDCELIDICKELGGTYSNCYKGAVTAYPRCDSPQKQSILQGHDMKKLQLEIQDREDKRQQLELELQRLRDKKAVRSSWIQLFVAALLGCILTKLSELMPQFIDWLRALLNS